jgi:hypothetical protein
MPKNSRNSTISSAGRLIRCDVIAHLQGRKWAQKVLNGGADELVATGYFKIADIRPDTDDAAVARRRPVDERIFASILLATLIKTSRGTGP